VSLATDVMNKDYGNCTNPSDADNKEWCQCEMSNMGPTKVCSCCPQVNIIWYCYLWPPRVADVDIIFCSCGYFL